MTASSMCLYIDENVRNESSVHSNPIRKRLPLVPHFPLSSVVLLRTFGYRLLPLHSILNVPYHCSALLSVPFYTTVFSVLISCEAISNKNSTKAQSMSSEIAHGCGESSYIDPSQSAIRANASEVCHLAQRLMLFFSLLCLMHVLNEHNTCVTLL